MGDLVAALRDGLRDRYAFERELEPLLDMPYTLTPAWLRIDPMFEPVRSHPRFKKLVEGTA